MPRRRSRSSGRGAATGAARGYPRAARVNELCREILAEEVERIDDERLDLVTVTHVEHAAVVRFNRWESASHS